MTPPAIMENEDTFWTIHIDGSSNNKGSGAGVIMENQDGVVVEVSSGGACLFPMRGLNIMTNIFI